MLFTLSAPLLWADDTERLELITDVADTLTSAQVEELNRKAETISEKYKCDVIVVIVEEIQGDDPEEYAWEIFDYYDMGYGSDKSTVMLLLATLSRQVALVAQGYGNTAFTDHGKDTILDEYLVPLLKDSKWDAAVYSFVEKAEEYLELATSGKPVDIIIPAVVSSSANTPPQEEHKTMQLVATILIPIAVAFFMCQAWAAQMQTAVSQRAASLYVTAAGLQLVEKEDTFTHRTETRKVIQSSSSSSGSGTAGGTTTNSSGRSGTSRSF